MERVKRQGWSGAVWVWRGRPDLLMPATHAVPLPVPVDRQDLLGGAWVDRITYSEAQGPRPPTGPPR